MKARWLWVCVILLAIAVRVIGLEHMEYKEDEEYNYVWSQMIGQSKPWPMWGMPSGVYVPNPGMSVWVFAALAKVTAAHDPVALARALAIFAVLGLALCSWLGRFSRDPSAWHWAGALALLNPIQVMYQRKLWPQGFLPFFMALTLAGWWKRAEPGARGFAAAAAWGFFGAWLGQIHMSGFFVAFALALVTAVSDFRATRRLEWFGAWFLGSVLGALPLIPWAIHALQLPPHPEVARGFGEMLQLKYWAFLLTNPWGLHVGNTLGLLRGPSHWQQLSDFSRYPLVAGHASWLVGAAHVALGGLFIYTLGRLVASGWKRLAIPGPERRLILAVALLAGVLMTLPAASIRRYYLMIAFPVDSLLLVYAVRAAFPRGSRRALAAIAVCLLVISASFAQYVRVNEGSAQGDYGRGFAAELRARENYGP